MPTTHQNRVASLLPALTQLVTELDAVDTIVACSHECQFSTVHLRTRTVVTRPKLVCANTCADVQIAAGWAAATNSAPPLAPDLNALTCAYYRVDLNALASTHPTLLVTILPEPSTDLAPSREEIIAALHQSIPSLRAVLHIDPATAAEIAAASRTVAAALGVTPQFSLSPQIQTPSFNRFNTTTVAVLQWADPIYLAGAWLPEAVRNAGAQSIHTRIGGPSISCTPAQLAQYDVVVFAVCALGLNRCTKIARNFLANHKSILAFQGKRIVAVDATRTFTFATPAMFRETTEIIRQILENRSNSTKWVQVHAGNVTVGAKR